MVGWTTTKPSDAGNDTAASSDITDATAIPVGDSAQEKNGKNLDEKNMSGDNAVVIPPKDATASNVGGYVMEKHIGRLAALPIEELVYHANLQRRKYGLGSPNAHKSKVWYLKYFGARFGPDNEQNLLRDENIPEPQITNGDGNGEGIAVLGGYPKSEWAKDMAEARSSLRTASWAMMFFIITTDVIGPTNCPYAFSTMGMVGGVMLYLTFGVMAFYGSWILLNLYMRLDSDVHPIHTYGELFEVFFGVIGHYGITIMQVVQILFIVGSNNIANAQSMTQLTANRSEGPLCFIVSIVIWTIIGWFNSVPFRSLAKLSYIAWLNVFINILVVFITMGIVSHSLPNYSSAKATYGSSRGLDYPDNGPYPPISVEAIATGPLYDQVNGAMNMVFGWSGLMIFIEFLNEMRHPYAFWKSFTLAQIIVLFIYILNGAYIYGIQGQYTLPVSFQGVSSYVWQSVCNGLSLWTYVMASVTYLNIGVKIVYFLIFEQIWKGPPLMSWWGFLYWTIMQTVAWAITFVLGAAIPQVQTIQGLVAAAILLNFSYTFPPLMQLWFDIQADASREDGLFSPSSGPQRKDSWRTWSRIKRGVFGGGWKRVSFKGFNAVIALAALATCGLGMWGSILTIIDTFATSQGTSFGCAAPV